MKPFSKLNLHEILSLYHWLLTRIQKGELSILMLLETDLLEKAAAKKGFKISHYTKSNLLVVILNKHKSLKVIVYMTQPN